MGAAFIMILALVVAYDHFIEKPKWLRHQQQLHELTNFQIQPHTKMRNHADG